MDGERKKGVVLIAVGVIIPLMVLPLVSGHLPGKGFFTNLLSIGIPLRVETRGPGQVPPRAEEQKQVPEKAKGGWERYFPTVLPFRFVVALGVLLVFIGIVKIDATRKRRNDEGA
jgi:hypothetical protein